jgi:multicomponent Na+:H+ antiporter subunit G
MSSTLATVATVAVAVLVAGGVVFTLVAAVGLVRLPDLYSRTHAASKSETLGAALALAGVAVAVGPEPAVAKVGLLLAFVFVTGPTAAHAIARAAYEEGHRPWNRRSPETTARGVATDGGDAAPESAGQARNELGSDRPVGREGPR